MTFGARTFMGMSQGSPIGFDPSVSNNSASTGIRSGSLGLSSDGSGNHTVHGTSTALSWYSPAGTGVGNNVWVKMTITSTTGTVMTGSSTGVVIGPISSSVGWTFTSSSAVNEGFGNFTLTFYADAGGTSVLSTQTGSWDVGYTP